MTTPSHTASPQLTFDVRDGAGWLTACTITVVPWWTAAPAAIDAGYDAGHRLYSSEGVLPESEEIDQVASRVIAWTGFHHHSRPGAPRGYLCDGIHTVGRTAQRRCPGGGTPLDCDRTLVRAALRVIPTLLEQTRRAINDLSSAGVR